MANALYDDYRERGVILVHVIIEDSPDADSIKTWSDAHYWAYTENSPPLKVLVLADTDGGLWNRYVQPCATGNPNCIIGCHVTPQYQIFDQAGVTVDDYCYAPDDASACQYCGYSDAHVRAVLDSLVPAKWCGEATP